MEMLEWNAVEKKLEIKTLLPSLLAQKSYMILQSIDQNSPAIVEHTN